MMNKYKYFSAALLMIMAQAAAAQDVIKLIIPTSPGGGTDSLFRAIAHQAEPHLDATLVVQNAGGAGGAIGVSQLARSKPDGLTVAGVWMGPITVAPHSIKTNYSMKDYIPVIMLDSAPYVLCVKPEFPASNGKELLDVLKSKPNTYTFGTDGVAGPGQLAAERIFQHFGVKARDVPYRGAGETMPALLGGVVDVYVGSVPPAVTMEKAKTAKCLLTTSAKPVPALPKATTLSDIGIPENETLLWHGIVAPAGTPDQAVKRIEDAFEKAASSPEMDKFFETAGVTKTILKRDEFSKYIQREYDTMGKMVDQLGLKQ